MSARKSSAKPSLAVADRLQRQLARIQAAQRKKFLSENIVRLEKNGDLSYESVRTVGVREDGTVVDCDGRVIDGVAVGREANHGLETEATHAVAGCAAHSHPDDAQTPANSNLLPNKLPQTPESQEIGNLIGASKDGVAVVSEGKHDSQAGLSCHEAPNAGNQNDTDPLTELLHRAVAATKVRRGRPASLDDQAKGQLIALLSVGMSMRQAAAILGVSHTTVQKTLKADPALAEEITAARFQAQLQPLACVIREARRSWKAATWLLKYLDAKIASHEETPDERRERQQRQTEEFLTCASGPNVKTRRVLG